MPTTDHERHTLEILRRIHRQTSVSQRSLASHTGIALGLTNSLVRRLVKQGFVRIRRIRSNHVHYLLTPRGAAEMARRAADSLENTLRLYTATRDRIRRQLARLQQAFPDRPPRIVLYGAGDVGELVYIGLNGSALRLVAVVDDFKSGRRFFGHDIRLPESVVAEPGDFDYVVVATFRKAHLIQTRLRDMQVEPHRIWSLGDSVDYVFEIDVEASVDSHSVSSSSTTKPSI